MGELINLAEHRPMDELFTATVYRRPDGTIYCGISSATDELFETTDGMSVADRMGHCLALLRRALPSMEEQITKLQLNEGE